MSDSPKPKLRWFRYTLRTLLLFVTIASVAFGGLGYKMRRAKQQQEAVQMISKLSGWVRYDYQYDADLHRFHTHDLPPGPEWLRNVFGIDFFSNVTYANLGFQEPATGLRYIGTLTELRTLDISDADIGDLDMKNLHGLKHLQDLIMWRGKRISDAGLEPFAGLTELKRLLLTDSKVKGDGLKYLEGLSKLRMLRLDGNPLNDEGLKHLEGLKSLEVLDLPATNVTDVGLSHLRGLTQLKTLSLHHTHITDAGLIHLRGLSQLTELGVPDTQVTSDGCEELLKFVPGLKIIRSSSACEDAI